jgi:hypothetical protein
MEPTVVEPAERPAPPSVCNQLLNSATDFAHSAVAAYRDEDWPVYYLHLATALEQLVKGALARANPAYVADAREFDALLHLTGRGERASAPEFIKAAKTITVTEALKRVGRLIDCYQPPSTLIDTLLERRNALAHAGAVVRGQEPEILAAVGRYVPQLLAYVGRTPTDLWGDDEATVREVTERRMDEIEAGYQRRLEAARLRFARWVDAYEPDTQRALLAVLEPTAPSGDYTEWPVECPACGHLGRLYGDPQPSWEAEFERDGDDWYASSAYVDAVFVAASSFECRVCRLSLVGDDLEAAGMDSRRFDDDDELENATAWFSAPDDDDDY